MSEIGVIPMPAGFKYRELFYKGRPHHEKLDPFRRKHPAMDIGKRAKIFAPFDALRGFSAAVIAKNEIYEYKRLPDEGTLQELSRQLSALQEQLPKNRSQEARIHLSVTFFVPCEDKNHEAYGLRGRYETVSGILQDLDPLLTRSLLIDGQTIPLDDILQIETDFAGEKQNESHRLPE